MQAATTFLWNRVKRASSMAACMSALGRTVNL